MRNLLKAFAIAAGVSLAATASIAAAEQGSAPAAAAADPVRALVNRVDIPHQSFTLANGLRVVVHEDRKAPIVAVSVWYNVGSKDEPAGRTGFAHLFEHLMFNGSENAPGDYFEPLREIGATDLNGTTSFDRTNYFQTVPTPALERALFLEADRMGHLLGAVTQEKLDNQRGVVQNEKRQGDNQPFGLVGYRLFGSLFPEGHPYRHLPIGSMADLDGASLEVVHQWFRDNYGPNNAVLVLAGDIDAASARPLVERFFGGIARGPVNVPAQADVPTLPQRLDEVMHDRVVNSRLYRTWATPGNLHDDAAALQVAGAVLGGLASSRLDNALVREDQSAISVGAGFSGQHRVGVFSVTVDVKPGQDVDAVSRRLDQLVTDFIASGPTDDEVRRTVMRAVSNRVQGLEQVGGFGGKAVALAEGMLYADDANFYRRRLEELSRVTPAQVRAAMQRWLTRPVYALRVDPGERGAYEEAATTQAAAPRAPAAAPPAPAPAPAPTLQMPAVTSTSALDFPAIERARLSNGIELVYARRAVVPVTRIAVEFDAGIAADPADRVGTQALMLTLLDEGTTSLNSVQLAEAQERLGATITTAANLDRTAIVMTAMTPALQPSLDLLADIVRNPAFAPREVERLRAQLLASIAQEFTQPQGLAARALPVVLYGAQHPYGKPASGDPAAVRAVTRDQLVDFHRRWIRPDNATIFAIGDLPLGEMVPLLEARFGNWRNPAVPRGTKQFPGLAPAAGPRIVLIDRPQSPQSIIVAGQLLQVEGTQDLLTLNAANEALGGNFLARINMELRERRGWSYGASGAVALREHQVPYLIQAPVQSDRTGESIQAVMEQLRGFLGPNGVQPPELNRIILGNTRQLPGQFETSQAVLGALRSNALYRRPDNYWETVADRYRALDAATLDQIARRTINPDNFVWVVVGDAARIRPQLERLNLPIEVMQLQGAPQAPAPAPAPPRPAQ